MPWRLSLGPLSAVLQRQPAELCRGLTLGNEVTERLINVTEWTLPNEIAGRQSLREEDGADNKKPAFSLGETRVDVIPILPETYSGGDRWT